MDLIITNFEKIDEHLKSYKEKHKRKVVKRANSQRKNKRRKNNGKH